MRKFNGIGLPDYCLTPKEFWELMDSFLMTVAIIDSSPLDHTFLVLEVCR